MTYEDDRNEGEIRRRAAWLFGMLAVVAVLVVVVMVFFLRSSDGGSGSDNNADPNYGSDPSLSASATASGAPSTGRSAQGSTTASPSSSATSTGPVPKPSCPSNDTCTVDGDIAGTLSAINDLRSEHDLSPVKATITDDADKCALTSGSDCPESYVWVHVDNLSGKAVVSAVQGFSGTDNLLDAGATKFGIGWAYDPGSDSAFCAVIRES